MKNNMAAEQRTFSINFCLVYIRKSVSSGFNTRLGFITFCDAVSSFNRLSALKEHHFCLTALHRSWQMKI